MLKIPTDNLYKFIAIAGLLVFVTGSILFYQTSNSLLDIYQQEYFNELEIETLTQEVNSTREQLNGVLDEVLVSSEQVKLEYIVLFKGGVIKYENRIKEVQENFIITKTKLSKVTEGRFLAQSLLWVGFLLTVVGFTLWYFKLQKYLDEYYQNNL